MSRYRVLETLGSGSGGTVYRALDVELKREIALKVMPAGAVGSGELLARFHREVKLLSALNHASIVRVYEPLQHDGAPAYTMDLVRGVSFAQLLRDEGAQPVDRALDLVQQAAEALAYVHAQGVVHRDLKPANLMLRDDGRVLVMDFGLARDLSGTVLTAQGVGLGTPRYMAPETLTGQPAFQPGDVYGLALVLHELITGKTAFAASRLEALVDQILRGPPPSLDGTAGVPKWLVTLQARATDRDPALRPTMAEYHQTLAKRPAARRAVTPRGDETAQPVRVPTPKAGDLHAARSRRQAVAAALLAVLGSAAGAWFVRARPWPTDPPAAPATLPPGPAVLGAPTPRFPRALSVPAAGEVPGGARLKVRAGARVRELALGSAGAVVEGLPPDAAVELAAFAADGRPLGTPVTLHTPALAPVRNLVVHPTDRDALVDFDASGAARLTVSVRTADGKPAGERTLERGEPVFHSVFANLAPDTDYVLTARTDAGWTGLAPWRFRTRGKEHARIMANLTGEVRAREGVDEYAASILASTPDTRAIPLLRRMIGSRSAATLTGLRAVARAVEMLRDRDLAVDLAALLPVAPTDAARAQVLRALAFARHPRAAELARAHLTSDTFQVLEAAAQCLAGGHQADDCDRIAHLAERFPDWVNFSPPMAECQPARARTWFRRWLDARTRDGALWNAALSGLELLAQPEDVAALRARLLGPREAGWEYDRLPEGTCRVLAHIAVGVGPAAEAAVTALEDAWREWPGDARVTAAMARLARPELAPRFADLLRSPSPRMRGTAVCALVAEGARDRVEAVRALIGDADRTVAALARWAVDRLSEQPDGDAAGSGGIPPTTWRPYLPRQNLGIVAFPGDVMDLAVSGTWRVAGTAVKPGVAQTVRPEHPRIAASVAVGGWQARIGMGPQLVPVAGEVALAPLDADSLTDSQDALDTLEGEVRVSGAGAR